MKQGFPIDRGTAADGGPAVAGDPASDSLLGRLGTFLSALDKDAQVNINQVCQYCRKLLGADFVTCDRFVPDKDQIVTLGGAGLPEDFRSRGRLRGRISHEEFIGAAKSRTCLHHLHLSGFWQTDPDLKKYGIKAYAGAPVIVDGTAAGCLAAYHSRTDAFTLEHAHVLEILGVFTGMLDERRHVVEDLHQKKNHEEMVAAISTKALADREKSSFLDHCLQIIGRSLKADTAEIYWCVNSRSRYRRVAAWQAAPGAGQADSDDLKALLHSAPVAEAVAADGIFCCGETGALPDPEARRLLRDKGIGALLIMHLSGLEDQQGLLAVQVKQAARDWRPEDVATLKIIMQIMGKWIESHTMACRLSEREVLHTQLMKKLPPAAIYGIDLVEQKFLYANEYMCRVMGYTEDEFLALNPKELLTQESREMFRERLMAMAAGRPVSGHVEFELVTKSGNTEWGQFYIRHIYENGRVTGATVVAHIITEYRREQAELSEYRRKLETLVAERTRELSDANRELRKEVDRHTNTARELRLNSERLREMNTTMRVLLDKRKEERERAEENIRINLKELIEPYLNRVEISGLNKSQQQMIDLIRLNLDEVFGTSVPEFSANFLFFTPNELQVVNLIRKGKTTKEIAHLLNISPRTVEAYRNSIRKKLGLKNKKVNLRTYLSSKK